MYTVAAGQSEATTKVVQKLKKRTAIFKKKRSKIQYKFNKLLDNHFVNALDELQKIPILEENLPLDKERRLTKQ